MLLSQVGRERLSRGESGQEMKCPTSKRVLGSWSRLGGAIRRMGEPSTPANQRANRQLPTFDGCGPLDHPNPGHIMGLMRRLVHLDESCPRLASPPPQWDHLGPDLEAMAPRNQSAKRNDMERDRSPHRPSGMGTQKKVSRELMLPTQDKCY